jgi:hypothetical protein
MKVSDENAKWARASLRIFSDTRTLDEIEAIMAVPATRSHRKGQPVGRRTPGARMAILGVVLE